MRWPQTCALVPYTTLFRSDLGLTLKSGIYGSTFFMLTGFHGFHVTMGAIILTVMLIRVYKGHFTPENHFGFERSEERRVGKECRSRWMPHREKNRKNTCVS